MKYDSIERIKREYNPITREILDNFIKNMEDRDKYFTPDIEDLCIGYECEINNAKGYKDDFEVTVIGYKIPGGYTSELSDIIAMVDDGYGEIRTPYLTKKQIEAEGWKNTLGSNYRKINDNTVFCYYENNSLIIWTRGMRSIFDGECKSINEFRKIIKFINI